MVEKVLDSFLRRSSFCIITSVTALLSVFPPPPKARRSSPLHTLDVVAFIQHLRPPEASLRPHRGKRRRIFLLLLQPVHLSCTQKKKKEDKFSGGQKNSHIVSFLPNTEEEMNNLISRDHALVCKSTGAEKG